MNLTLNLLVEIMKKRSLFIYSIYAYIFLSSPTLQSESVTVRHDATEVI